LASSSDHFDFADQPAAQPALAMMLMRYCGTSPTRPTPKPSCAKLSATAAAAMLFSSRAIACCVC
jgi:hypothetical protein